MTCNSTLTFRRWLSRRCNTPCAVPGRISTTLPPRVSQSNGGLGFKLEVTMGTMASEQRRGVAIVHHLLDSGRDVVNANACSSIIGRVGIRGMRKPIVEYCDLSRMGLEVHGLRPVDVLDRLPAGHHIVIGVAVHMLHDGGPVTSGELPHAAARGPRTPERANSSPKPNAYASASAADGDRPVSLPPPPWWRLMTGNRGQHATITVRTVSPRHWPNYRAWWSTSSGCSAIRSSPHSMG